MSNVSSPVDSRPISPYALFPTDNLPLFKTPLPPSNSSLSPAYPPSPYSYLTQSPPQVQEPCTLETCEFSDFGEFFSATGGSLSVPNPPLYLAEKHPAGMTAFDLDDEVAVFAIFPDKTLFACRIPFAQPKKGGELIQAALSTGIRSEDAHSQVLVYFVARDGESIAQQMVLEDLDQDVRRVLPNAQIVQVEEPQQADKRLMAIHLTSQGSLNICHYNETPPTESFSPTSSGNAPVLSSPNPSPQEEDELKT